uniref:Neural proliferation differentiation and control protein 1 n=1 Tax=Schistocephalus solidus TaxID=70667 RepID=A0A0X3NZY3_SCHSO
MNHSTTELNPHELYENNPETDVFWAHWRGAVIGCSLFLALIAIIVLFVLLVCYCVGNRNKRKKGSEEKKAKLSSEPVPANPPPYQSSYVPQYVQPPEERKLAPSAQMLHYQYKRDQLHNADAQINNLDGSPSGHSSDVEDTRVYESAGLAQTDTSEVKNPLFQ